MLTLEELKLIKLVETTIIIITVVLLNLVFYIFGFIVSNYFLLKESIYKSMIGIGIMFVLIALFPVLACVISPVVYNLYKFIMGI